MSLPEVLFWRALRDRPGGFNFRRQHPSGPYVADFYCHAARLIIELDSEAHERGDRPARDAARDAWFAQRGLFTARLAACDVLDDLDAVVRHLVTLAATRTAGAQ
ncbi:endonuclease domain-containing protein [Sphingomonas sp. BK345]|uniref:endonuclease domain-containing protein n=1 Tax=Sphingomonas sp. BK345 TaxID=2586980 RepID=UPI0018046B2A|nr:very-short-patch-repair endonuclease [Sphingomonas sp. BK345]